jgi:GH24 family phage-related lysozyme (muramidase)
MPAALRDVPQDGIELIKSFEGIPDGDPTTVRIDAYLDPVGIWTIGWGHAIKHQGAFLRGAQNRSIARSLFPGGITREQAEALLRGDLVDTAACVARLAPRANDNQFAALVSFAFNAGVTALQKSTLMRKLLAGDLLGAADQFLVWNKARNGQGVLVELAGLTRRRRAERALFLGQDWRAAAASRSRGRVAVHDADAGVPGARRVDALARGALGDGKPAAEPGASKALKAKPKTAGKTAAKKAPSGAAKKSATKAAKKSAKKAANVD